MASLSLRSFKGPVPKIPGQEVKSVSFNLEALRPRDGNVSDAVRAVVQNWLEVEFAATKVSDLWLESARATLIDESGQELAKFDYLLTRSDSVEVFELHVRNRFYRGQEVTRLRFVFGDEGSHLEISSFIQLSDQNRLAEEVPLIADSLGPMLFASRDMKLSIEGEASIRPFPFEASKQRYEALRALQQGRGPLPLVVVRASEVSLSEASRTATEFFGLAHTVIVEDVSAVNTRPTLSVHWRDGSDKPTLFDSSTQRFRLFIQLRALHSRRDQFPSIWSRANNLAGKSDRHKVAGSQSEQKHLDLLAEMQLRLEVADSARVKSEKELGNYARVFDQEIEDLKAKNEDLKRQLLEWNRKQFERAESKGEHIKSIRPDLEPNLLRRDVDAMLDDLVTKCGGAIEFTSGVSKTWRQALKNGYDKPRKMEKALHSLCLIAFEYRQGKGKLKPLDEFAKHNFDTELILFDSLDSPTFEFQGKTLDQRPHIKADAGNTVGRLGRIHFAIDLENLRLVVNHMGSKIHPSK